MVPTGAKVISILLIFSGLINAFFLILALALNPVAVFISILVNLFVVIVGIFLWLGENWARIAAIVLSSITVFNCIAYLLMGNFFAVINLILNMIILIYLSFSKDVREAFLSRKGYDEELYEHYSDYEEYDDDEDSEGWDDEGFAEVLSEEDSEDGVEVEDEHRPNRPKMTFIIKGRVDEYD